MTTLPASSQTYTTLRKWLADDLGWGLSAITGNDSDRLDMLINAGYRQALFPPPLPPSPKAHSWTFLKPRLTIATVSGQSDYPLPADYGYLLGPLSYSSSDSAWVDVVLTGLPHIYHMRQTVNSGRPTFAAVEPCAPTATSPQQWKLLLYPTPDGVYSLSGRYAVQVNDITSTTPYPLGGPAFGDFILQSCLAMGEQWFNKEQGPHTARFQERLRAMIEMDKQQSPEFLGYFGDHSDGPERGIFHNNTSQIGYWVGNPPVLTFYDGS